MSDINIVPKRAGLVLSNGNNKYIFSVVSMAPAGELNCCIVYIGQTKYSTIYTKNIYSYADHNIYSTLLDRR
jgi:hypothetical protein